MTEVGAPTAVRFTETARAVVGIPQAPVIGKLRVELAATPVQSAVWAPRGVGAPVVLVGVQVPWATPGAEWATRRPRLFAFADRLRTSPLDGAGT